MPTPRTRADEVYGRIRADILAVALSATLGEVLAHFRLAGHSRPKACVGSTLRCCQTCIPESGAFVREDDEL